MVNDNSVISSVNNYFFIYDAELNKLKVVDVENLELNYYNINSELEFKSGKEKWQEVQ